eukprot:2059136-Pleurochrysis_carterae.AAC.1
MSGSMRSACTALSVPIAMNVMRGTHLRGSGVWVLASTSIPVDANWSASSCASESACPSRSSTAARNAR